MQLVDFFDNHSHRTVFRDELSSLLGVSASIIQGSAIGPAAYVVGLPPFHFPNLGRGSLFLSISPFLSPLPFFSPHLFLPPYFPLPLEVGPLNPPRKSGGAL